MKLKADHLRALALICRRWGGRLAVVSQDWFYDMFDNYRRDDANLYESPFADSHGLDWQRKVIYAVRGRERVGVIIHEMGHVFAAQHHPECFCATCHEWNWLGWEFALARQIGAVQAWSRHNANYATGNGSHWAGLSSVERRAVVAKRLRRARKIGVVDAGGAPRSMR
jgi:hypothetical protein